MKTLAMAATISLVSLVAVDVAMAQVSSDRTLSTTVNASSGNNFVIENGDRAGNNLFHSFREFSVPTGGSAYFNNAADVQNIFSRVTGSNVSNIDGLIRANGNANLFLLNPNGIIFGSHASLNIGGSFIGTTANSLRFADGVEFTTTTSTGTPLLTISAPVGLQMGQSPGAIAVNNTGHRLTTSRSAPPNRGTTPVGLSVTRGNTLALIGGEISSNGGVLTAPSGHIELGSATNGTVNLNTSVPKWSFNYANVEQLGNVRLSRQSLVDATGAPAGSIHLQGRNIALSDGSAVLLNNQGNQNSGDIIVNASESLELRGVGTYGFSNSLLQASNLGIGAGGNVVVSAPRVLVQDGAKVTSQTFSGGGGGNILIDADSIQALGFSSLVPSINTTIAAVTTGLGGGQGGNLQIATRRLRIEDGASVLVSSSGIGNAGNATVNASELIEVIGENRFSPSSLVAPTLNRGNAGQLTVTTPRLRVLDGASVATVTLGAGNAGSLRVNASDEITVRGRGEISGVPSRLAARAEILSANFQQLFNLPAFPTGNSGNLSINTSRLRVTDGAIVGVDHQGVGNAGDLRLNADRILLDRAGSITASTRSGGGGNMNLRTNALTLRRGGNVVAIASGAGNGGQVAIAADTLDLLSNSYISTQAQGVGNAGNLNLRVDQLSLNNGRIAVESQGTGNAGRLTINADLVQLNNRSLINASTQVGQGGNVQLQVRDMLQLNGHSQVLADAQQSGQGGNVRIAASEAVLQDRSRITTNAQGTAVGGSVNFEGDRLTLLSGSQITSSTSGSDRAGSLTIVANDAINLSGRRTRLAATSSTDAPAGSILLRSPEVTVSDRATVSVSGQGSGGAGDLTVDANRINLDQRGSLEAEVAGGDRGNITLNSSTLLLRNGSTITTNATGTASGGNINVDTNFLIGLENSDIVARAEQGQGGNIGLTAQSVLGILPRAQLTSNSDINASSQLGFDGAISITNPDVKPDSGLVELPAEIVDSSQQIAATCSSTQDSQFIITGRGGIPTSPDALQEGDRFWSDLRDLSAFSNDASVSSQPISSSLQPAALSEVNQWSVNAKGQVELVAVASLDSSNFTQPTCNTSFTEHD